MKRLPYNYRPRKWDDPYTRFMMMLGLIGGTCLWMLLAGVMLLQIAIDYLFIR